MNITKSSNIKVSCINEQKTSWQVIAPFSIYVPDLDSRIDTLNGDISWHDDRGGKGNFPDFKDYYFFVDKNGWSLIYRPTQHVIMKGSYKSNTLINDKQVYIGHGNTTSLINPVISQEDGIWICDIKGYKVGDIINGERLLTVY